MYYEEKLIGGILHCHTYPNKENTMKITRILKEPPQGMFSIRWRKASATYVIYHNKKVFESGFESQQHAINYLIHQFGDNILKQIKQN